MENTQTISNQTKTNSYYFQCYRWIPSYRDFDSDDITIQASNEEEAWKEFNKYMTYCKSAGLVSINGVKVNN
jgi:hypothetical protein